VLIINADDWGRSEAETDAALACCQAGSVTSVSAMVFMQDSERAAHLAKNHAIDAGLHLNLSQSYNASGISRSTAESQQRIVEFMKRSKYAVMFYHPILRTDFRRVFNDQLEEFTRLYGKVPTHIDGHQHRHLCANMLIDEIIPAGQTVRRNFTFFENEKSWINRHYRGLVDRWLSRRYRIVEFFFSLKTCLRHGEWSKLGLAGSHLVELMAHPVNADEYDWLLSPEFKRATSGLPISSFCSL
jgi:predicted glycoside hydrolase/deacetylase ChbG (UPF0249 family)